MSTVSYTYDGNGNELNVTDENGLYYYRYSGEYYDAESGYIYLRARYYDSTTGRFISEDPAFDGFNWYAYCGGNPLNRWDPSGQAWYDWMPGIASVIAGTIMCVTGVGAPVGIGLIVGGVSSLASTGLRAAGFDSKTATMLTAGVDIVGGAALLLTPFAPVGAGMIGSGFGSLAGGAISEKLGGSYELGATIGNIVGGVAGSVTYSKIVSMKNISATKAPNNECHPNCFIAGTLVATSGGYKAIEEIQAGDMVLAENPKTGEIALKRVVQAFENESDELVHVFVNGEEIITTPNHPFYVPKLGWTSAIKLRAGDVLVLSNGEYVVVEFVQHEILESPVEVYNFEVEDFHTYFVGGSSVLVHNKCSNVQGTGHGKTPYHKNTIDAAMDDFAKYGYGTNGRGGDYDAIYGNRKLKTAGLNGNQQPDIITVRTQNGKTIYDIYEFASPSQYTGSTAYNTLLRKIQAMRSQNPNTSTKIINFYLFDWGSY